MILYAIQISSRLYEMPKKNYIELENEILWNNFKESLESFDCLSKLNIIKQEVWQTLQIKKKQLNMGENREFLIRK